MKQLSAEHAPRYEEHFFLQQARAHQLDGLVPHRLLHHTGLDERFNPLKQGQVIPKLLQNHGAAVAPTPTVACLEEAGAEILTPSLFGAWRRPERALSPRHRCWRQLEVVFAP